ncbi:murein L,D-transpeptidase catalytic domain family protein [Cognatilysobacter terrigena]|uniref:murein L,D-transpeptidase catalytic domain family protein n=1 Tax=Cognatilysobacter terrigena TaxID=2488749 RepID=UPI001FEA1100|nr:murein L,D-transpeptidase catalytic domain family protein [Lysobacter terrigena]
MSLASRLASLAPGANPKVIEMALEARECAISSGDATGAGEKLAVIDYSMPSTQKRLWVFDLRNPRVMYSEYVAHGQGTGENYARNFSNLDGSHQTSLGLFRTAETYTGNNGYSLRMDGLEPGFNDNARARAIVMHGAWYVDPSMAQKMGRIGRSHGCPAVRAQVAHEIIDTLKGGQFVFSYYPDNKWLHESRLLACPTRSTRAVVAR